MEHILWEWQRANSLRPNTKLRYEQYQELVMLVRELVRNWEDTHEQPRDWPRELGIEGVVEYGTES